MARHLLIVIACHALFLPAVSQAATYVVRPDGSGDFPTIQAAFDAAAEGDVIELADGVFTGDGNRDLDFHGKAITARPQSGNPSSCVLDCQGTEHDPHRAFHCRSGEGPETRVVGVTIVNGRAAGT